MQRYAYDVRYIVQTPNRQETHSLIDRREKRLALQPCAAAGSVTLNQRGFLGMFRVMAYKNE